MRLADFIEQNVCLIADGAQAFAATQTPQGVHLDETALRDHIPEILLAVVADLRTKQSAEAQLLKSEGRASVLDGPRTPASTHGMLRAKGGFDINQMVAEYRALRAAVLRLWIDAHGPSKQSFNDMIRFNEAIDQAISESVSYFFEGSRVLAPGVPRRSRTRSPRALECHRDNVGPAVSDDARWPLLRADATHRPQRDAHEQAA